MLELDTLTRHLRLETRQYELLGKDLGDGVRRVAMLLGAATFAGWALLLLLLGVPVSPKLGFVYLLPPALITFRGLTADDSGRRLVVTGWLWRLRYLSADRWLPLVGLRLHFGEPGVHVTAAPHLRSHRTSAAF